MSHHTLIKIIFYSQIRKKNTNCFYESWKNTFLCEGWGGEFIEMGKKNLS